MTFTIMSRNTRFIGGNIQHRRFAYLNEMDRERFGLFEATDSKDARHYHGSTFYIRQTSLTEEVNREKSYDRDLRWEVVS